MGSPKRRGISTEIPLPARCHRSDASSRLARSLSLMACPIGSDVGIDVHRRLDLTTLLRWDPLGPPTRGVRAHRSGQPDAVSPDAQLEAHDGVACAARGSPPRPRPYYVEPEDVPRFVDARQEDPGFLRRQRRVSELYRRAAEAREEEAARLARSLARRDRDSQALDSLVRTARPRAEPLDGERPARGSVEVKGGEATAGVPAFVLHDAACDDDRAPRSLADR